MQDNIYDETCSMQSFIQRNAYFIYEYINEVVLHESGKLYPEYFAKMIHDVVIENRLFSNEHIDINLIPYFLFTKLFGDGQIPYTSARKGTITFDEINKTAKTYYNYIAFSLDKEQTFYIKLVQSKIGGMPISEDIIKYSKQIQLKHNDLIQFIEHKKNNFKANEEFTMIQQSIESLFLQNERRN